MIRFIKTLQETKFESSSVTTPQFKKFVRQFRNDMKNLLETYGAHGVEIDAGHFYISGFFTAENGQIWYISLSDVRWMIGGMRMLIRTAESYKDYTGGSNGFIELDRDFDENLLKVISRTRLVVSK